jgi:branched-chain amino acid transport system ATP-binding protein
MSQSLSASFVSVSFEGLKALSNVSLDVPREKVTGLIGPNGAGKTTLVNVLTGFQKPTAGEVTLDGEAIGGVPPHKVRKKGVARTFPVRAAFPGLSVLDNLEVTGVGLGLSRREAAAKADRCSSGSAFRIWPSAWPEAFRIRMNAASPSAVHLCWSPVFAA